MPKLNLNAEELADVKSGLAAAEANGEYDSKMMSSYGKLDGNGDMTKRELEELLHGLIHAQRLGAFSAMDVYARILNSWNAMGNEHRQFDRSEIRRFG